MIKRLTIQNFQSHKASVIKFHPGVNVIIGQSDCGKTAILRALDWVCNNRPSGDDFRSSWGGDTIVEVTLKEKKTIGRSKRGKTGNEYCLITEDGVEVYKAFNKDVPDDIIEVLNMDPLNWQRQLDAPFLLSETAGEVATRLNRIVNLNVIDESISKTVGRIRANSQAISAQEELIQTTSEQLESLDYLDQLEDHVGNLEKLQKKRDDLEEGKVEIFKLISSLCMTRDRLEAVRKIIPAVEQIESLEALVKRRQMLSDEREALKSIGKAYKALRRDREQSTLLIASESAVQLILSDVQRLEELKAGATSLSKVLKQLSLVIRDLACAQADLEVAETKYHELMPDECPLCERSMT